MLINIQQMKHYYIVNYLNNDFSILPVFSIHQINNPLYNRQVNENNFKEIKNLLVSCINRIIVYVYIHHNTAFNYRL